MSRVRADRYTDRAGTGSPTFSEGVNVVGISSLGITTVTGVGQTALTVNGDARITGVLTVGQGSVTIGSTNITTQYINDLQYPTAGPLSNRNLIINGAMQVAQRSTSVTGLTNVDSGYHTVDRFRFGEQGAPTCVFTNTQSGDAPTGFSSSFRLDTTTAESPMAAADTVFTDYRVEAQDLQCLGYGTADAKSITLSFYVKSTVSGTYVVWFYAPDGSVACTHTYTIAAGEVGTWQYRTITVTGDTSNAINNDNGIGFFIRFVLAAGTNWTSGTASTTWNTASVTDANRFPGQTANIASSTSDDWSITGVQLELGTRATPFEHENYTLTLTKCKRYFQYVRMSRYVPLIFRGSNNNAGSSSAYSLPVPMRTNASSTVSVASIRNFSALNSTSSTTEAGTMSVSTGFYNGPDAEYYAYGCQEISNLANNELQILANYSAVTLFELDAEL